MPDEKPDEKPGQPVKTETNDKPEPVETTEVSISSAQATINQDLLLVSSNESVIDSTSDFRYSYFHSMYSF